MSKICEIFLWDHNIYIWRIARGGRGGSSPSVRDNNRAVASRVSSNRACSSFTRAKNAVRSKARHLSSIEREKERENSLHPLLGSVTALASIYEATVETRGKICGFEVKNLSLATPWKGV